jgi:hypothetical protein
MKPVNQQTNLCAFFCMSDLAYSTASHNATVVHISIGLKRINSMLSKPLGSPVQAEVLRAVLRQYFCLTSLVMTTRLACVDHSSVDIDSNDSPRIERLDILGRINVAMRDRRIQPEAQARPTITKGKSILELRPSKSFICIERLPAWPCRTLNDIVTIRKGDVHLFFKIRVLTRLHVVLAGENGVTYEHKRVEQLPMHA